MTTIVAIAVVAILVTAIGFVMVQQRWQRIRQYVSPKHEPAMNESGNRGGAEQELRARQGRAATLDIKPLTPQSQRTYAECWTAIQKQFADGPGPAVIEADRLVTAAMAERGYPTEDFEQQQSESAAVHDRMLHRYRQAHEISGCVAQGKASTEDVRQAMVHYHVLFQELLDSADEHHRPQPADRTRDDQSTSQGDSRNGSRKGDAT
ncbi:hypothetical protein ACIBO5_30000 [Nonomuraea angiospora]|uniref:hypothetical protein n=1 Tax=Nonomuraea angiospora TaxID=46172 RepID=UPI00378ABE48